jgi:8-oxo-dGTP pyrophosphatase MutT (NUDIX family)
MDIPASLKERAAAYLRGEVTPAPTHDAASVILLQDRDSHLEVYLLQRRLSMAFAPGAHVFPGGTVDGGDDAPIGWCGPDSAWWAGQLTCDESSARSLCVAAVRETFEESGVLLAGPTCGEVVGLTTDDGWEVDRHHLVEHTSSMAQLLAQRSLLLRSDLLRPWAHWTTPEFAPRRFDTRFFVAAVPAAQLARMVGGEADAAVWMRPADVVSRHEAGELHMMPPTISIVRELCDYVSVEDVLRVEREIRPLLPTVVADTDDVRLVLDEGQ